MCPLSIRCTLWGCYVEEASRPQESEAFFKRELKILEAKNKPDDLSIVSTLFVLGVAFKRRDGGRRGKFTSSERWRSGRRQRNQTTCPLSKRCALCGSAFKRWAGPRRRRLSSSESWESWRRQRSPTTCGHVNMLGRCVGQARR